MGFQKQGQCLVIDLIHNLKFITFSFFMAILVFFLFLEFKQLM